MKTSKYFVVSNTQIILTALLVAIMTASLVMINISMKEYFQLPVVNLSSDGKCALVSNYRNGEAYTCNDVDVILRNYRVKNK